MKTAIKLLSIAMLPFVIGISMPDKEHTATYNSGSINPEHLDGPFTGGFGEQTCHSCHFDYDLNPDGGSLSLTGIEDTFEPGKSYEIIVKVESEHLEIGGFQMTSRFEDGTQAGKFNWDSDRLMLTPSISDNVQYLQHSREGTQPTDDWEVSWSFEWEAPESERDVIFNIAANAGNNDDSAFGDWIYIQEHTTETE